MKGRNEHEETKLWIKLINVEIRPNEGLTLETPAFQIFHSGILSFINSFDGQTFM